MLTLWPGSQPNIARLKKVVGRELENIILPIWRIWPKLRRGNCPRANLPKYDSVRSDLCAVYTTPQIESKRNLEILKFNINQKFQIQGVRDIEARVFLPNPESSSHSNCPPYNIYVQMLKEQNVKLCFSHCWLWSRSKVGKKLGTMQDECQREFIYLHTLFHRKSASRRRFRSFLPRRGQRLGVPSCFPANFALTRW